MSAFRFPHVYLLVTLVKSDVCYACWVRVSSPFEIALQNGMALGVGVLKEAPRLPETCRGVQLEVFFRFLAFRKQRWGSLARPRGLHLAGVRCENAI
jgi:hypothetical protein